MHASQLCPTLCDPMDCGPPGSSVQGIIRQDYWSGLPCPSPGDLLDPGIKPASPESPTLYADYLPNEPPGKPVIKMVEYNYQMENLNYITQPFINKNILSYSKRLPINMRMSCGLSVSCKI